VSDATPVDLDHLVAIPTYRDAPATSAADLAGTDAERTGVQVRVVGTAAWTLLLFLSSSCDGCRTLWDAVEGGWTLEDGAIDLVVVTRDPAEQDPRALPALPPGVPLVMSSAAWSDYRVYGPPFFVLVDGPGRRVVTEGVAWGIEQMADHVARARRDPTCGPDVPRLNPQGPEQATPDPDAPRAGPGPLG
jgi:hypothetical protein